MGTQKFPDRYAPTVAENYDVETEFDGTVVHMNIWDLGGQEEYAMNR